ncbi:MAG: hypothetical protein WEA09_03505 [Gemmatimonadota bacterium]
MHTLVRRFIKTGGAFLMVGLVLGFWILLSREILGRGAHPHLVSAHTHALLSGFMLFLIFGVALWMFPKPPKGDGRYTPDRGRMAWWILLLGTSVRVGGEFFRSIWFTEWIPWVIVSSGVLQLVGSGWMLWMLWPRIRGVGSPAREARGERF